MRKIIAFEQDEAGAWIARLACGHSQHMRHDPPWTLRPWVLTEEGRARFIGAEIDCAQCRAAK